MESEVNPYSPIRVFDNSPTGQLQHGELGVLMAPAGAGKSTCLAQIALDYLLHRQRVAHVTLDRAVQRVRDRYDGALEMLCRIWEPLHFDSTTRVEIERLRHIFSYHHHKFSVAHLDWQLRLVIEHQHFKPELVIIDGFDFRRTSESEIGALKELASSLEARVWMAARTIDFPVRPDAGHLPPSIAPLVAAIDVLLCIENEESGPHLRVVKDRDAWQLADPAAWASRGEPPIALDPRSLLKA